MAAELILICVEDADLSTELAVFLRREGYRPVVAATLDDALTLCRSGEIGVALIDRALPGAGGLAPHGHEGDPHPTAILLGRPETPVAEAEGSETVPSGYLPKPIDPEHLRFVVGLVVANRRLARENRYWRSQGSTASEIWTALGSGRLIQRLRERVAELAPSSRSVLIVGERGSGKRLVAHALHDASPRKDGPFVTFDCAGKAASVQEHEIFGCSEGAQISDAGAADRKVALARGGTLFLDTIETLAPLNQIRLLHLIQQSRWAPQGEPLAAGRHARIVAGTSSDLAAAVEKGHFRADLLYCLSGATIAVPSLRQRREDIPHLARRALPDAAKRHSRHVEAFAEEALAILLEHDWPGNLDELEGLVDEAVAVCPDRVLQREHLPARLRRKAQAATPRSDLLCDVEREHILRVLRRCNWNKHEAARLLRISKSTLYSKIKQYGVNRR